MEGLPGPHKVLTFMLFIIVFACSERPEPEQLDYKNITFDTANYTVNFCKAFPLEWDSILVVHPYMRSESWSNLGLKNIDPIEEKLEIMESIDWKNYLVFIKNNQVIAFSDIPRGFIDFKIQQATSPTFISKEDCTLKVFSKETGHKSLTIPN